MYKVFLLIILGGVSFICVAQRETIKRQPFADVQKYHFGFHLGIHVSDLYILQMGEERQNNHWFAGVPSYYPGLSVGVIADRRFHEYLNLRVSPTVHLVNRKIYFYHIADFQKEYVNITSGYLQVPVDIKFSSLRLNNYRPYVIGGIYGMYDFGSKIVDNLHMKKWDYGISFGVGCDLYFYYFKLSPEIRFCFGLPNVWYNSDSTEVETASPFWKKAISKAKTRLIILTFNFE